jgi:hypothetical protein
MTDIERTKSEALLDLRYQIRLHFLHARLFRRFRAFSAILSLGAGSAALISALQGSPRALAALGIIVALVSAADVVLHWSERAATHSIWQRDLSDLLARSTPMTLEDLDSEMTRLIGPIDDEIESLRVPAFNDNVRSNGHEDWVRPESLLQRLISAIA